MERSNIYYYSFSERCCVMFFEIKLHLRPQATRVSSTYTWQNKKSPPAMVFIRARLHFFVFVLMCSSLYSVARKACTQVCLPCNDIETLGVFVSTSNTQDICCNTTSDSSVNLEPNRTRCGKYITDSIRTTCPVILSMENIKKVNAVVIWTNIIIKMWHP